MKKTTFALARSPIPEPGTLALLGAALAGLAFRWRKGGAR